MLIHSLKRALVMVVFGPLAGCGAAGPEAPSAGDRAARGAAAAAQSPPEGAVANGGGQFVRMMVDGVEWAADREIFCTQAPAGMAPMLIVSGSHGPKDANGQVFNLNLGNVHGPGTLRPVGGGSVAHVIQLANLDERRYLNGGAMGFDVKVEVIDFARDPTRVELRFEGTLNGSAGTHLGIEEGHVRCSE